MSNDSLIDNTNEQFKPNLLSKLSNDELIKIIEHISEFYEEKLDGFAKFHDEKIHDLFDKIEDYKHYAYLKEEEYNQLEEEHFNLMDEYHDLSSGSG